MKLNSFFIFFTILILLQIPVLALAQESSDGPEDLEVFGLELEKLLYLGSGILALLLSILTFLAYSRTKKDRLIYVSLAFLLFSIKSLLISTELFIPELPYVDPLSAFLDFFILLTFFYGVLKR